MARHREDGLDTNFEGTTYETILWHAACHQRAQQIGPKSSQLMQLTGAKVTVVERCSAIDGTWGLRAENLELAQRVAKPLMTKVSESRCATRRRRLPARERRDHREHRQATGTSAAGARARVRRGRGLSVRKLTVDDIIDLRAYERERDDFRRRIIELKRSRRVALGPIMSIVFENTDTMRWQVQEMARAERMLRDEQIAHEVETYNELIPDAGELSATLLLELTSELAAARVAAAARRHRATAFASCFPTAPAFRAGRRTRTRRASRAKTRPPAVHFLKFAFAPEQIEMFASGPGTHRRRPSRVRPGCGIDGGAARGALRRTCVDVT